MTELQFTPGYIAYILSDEAKVLQAGHELKCWDFFVWDGVIYVVTGVGCDGIYAAKADGRGKASWLNVEEDLSGRELWLPTLFQLIGVIEGAGWWWRIRVALRGDKKYEMAAAKPGVSGFRVRHTIESDLLLAAAQLAVRAVEGK